MKVLNGRPEAGTAYARMILNCHIGMQVSLGGHWNKRG